MLVTTLREINWTKQGPLGEGLRRIRLRPLEGWSQGANGKGHFWRLQSETLTEAGKWTSTNNYGALSLWDIFNSSSLLSTPIL